MTTVYIGGVYEWQAGASTAYYTGPDGPVAFRRSGYATDNGVFYLLRDHLGSSGVIVDGSGNVAKRAFYYPYGGNRGDAFSDLTTRRFTGQYHEQDLPGGEGLSYYNARWYDAQLGRFVSADTIVPNPANPQAFNRYAYVLNSPLGHVDPSGHEPCPSGNWGDCLPPSKNNDPVRNSTRLYNQQSSYSSKGTRWEDVPGETRAYWRTWGINKGRYQDCCGNAKLQKGLKDPATVISGVVGVWRLGGQALRLAPQAFRWLTGGATAACADGDCGNELRQASESGSKVVDFARSLQGSGNYPGVDRYMQVTLKQGTIVYGGAPGQSHFYTTADAMEKSGRSASRLFQGLQVAPHPVFGYRPGVTAYEVTEDVVVAFGRALANPQHGQGGLPQIVIENYERFLRPVYSIPLLP